MDPIGRLIDQLYDGALDPAAWPAAFTSICTLLDADHAVGMVRDNDAANFPLVAAARVEPSNLGRFVAAIPGPMDMLRGISERRSFDFSSVVPREEFVRSDFFQDVIRPMGGFRAMMTIPFRQHGHDSFVAICRSQRAGDFTEAEARILERVVPHITRAMRVRLRIDRADTRLTAALAAFDQIEAGLVIVDRMLRPVALNRRAERAIAERDGLAISRHALEPTDPAAIGSLRDFARRAAADDPRVPVARALLLRRGGGRPPWLVTARRLDSGAAPAVAELVALLLEDPRREPADIAPLLTSLFHLTPQQAALAAALSRGATLSDAAKALGIAVGTARNYLKIVFNKTHTRRQAELVSLVLHVSRLRR